MQLLADGKAAVEQAVWGFQAASRARLRELLSLDAWGQQHGPAGDEEQASEVEATCHDGVQIELEARFHGIIPAKQRQQVYEITVYIFLPAGTEAKEVDRPFAHIRTAASLHTPKVALLHLSTQFAPIMLQGQFTAILQAARNKLRTGKDVAPLMAQILQQLYLQAALYETALQHEAEQVVKRMRHSGAGCDPHAAMDSAAQSITLAVKRIVEAIQRLQQMCSECSNAGEAGETWARVHEHVLLTSERVLLDVLQGFDDHLRDQGVELLQRASSVPLLAAAEGLPEAKSMRRVASEGLMDTSSSVNTQAPQPTTLRELLLSLAKVGSAGAATGTQRPPSPIPDAPPPPAARLVRSSPAAVPVRLEPAAASGAQERARRADALQSRPSRLSALLDVRKAEQSGGRASYVQDGVLERLQPMSKALMAVPASPFSSSPSASSKHGAIAAAAARTVSNIRAAQQPPASPRVPPPAPVGPLKPQNTRPQARTPQPAPAKQGGVPVPSPFASEDAPNPFTKAAGGPSSRRLEKTREINSMPSQRASLDSAPSAIRQWGSWAPGQGPAAAGDAPQQAKELRSRLGEALLRRASEVSGDDPRVPPSASAASGSGELSATSLRTARDGSGELPVSGFDRKLEMSKAFQALPKPRDVRSLVPGHRPEEAEPKPLPVKLQPQQPADGAREGAQAPATLKPAAKPLMVSPFAAATQPVPWQPPAPAPALLKTSSIPNLRELEAEASPVLSASVPPFKPGQGGAEALEASARRITWSQSMLERGPQAGGLTHGAQDLLRVIMKDFDGNESSGSLAELPGSRASSPPAETEAAQPEADGGSSGLRGQARGEPPLPLESPAPLAAARPGAVLGRSVSIVRGPVDQTEQLRRFALRKTQTRRAIDYTPPAELAALPDGAESEAASEGSREGSEESTGSESSEHEEWKDSRLVVAKLREGQPQDGGLRQPPGAPAQPGERRGRSGLSLLRAFKARRLSPAQSSRVPDFRSLSRPSPSPSGAGAEEEPLESGEEAAGEEPAARVPSDSGPPALNPASFAASYVKPKRQADSMASQQRQHRASDKTGDQAHELRVAPRDDSVGDVMYVHTPTPQPAEDVANPLPERVSSKFRRTWRHLSSSDFLAGHAAKIERQQLSQARASNMEAVSELHGGESSEREAQEEPSPDAEDLISHVGPLAKRSDAAIDAVLRRMSQPKTQLRRNQAVTLTRPGQPPAQPPPPASLEMPGRSRQLDVELRGGKRFWGRVGSSNSDAGPGDASWEELRQLKQERLRALRATHLRTGARFEMQRWGVAFQTATGLPGVLRRARLLQLRQAEHPQAVGAQPDVLRVKALLRQARALLCAAAEGMQEERRHFGLHDALPESPPEEYAARAALVSKTAVQATALTSKPMKPRPAMSDIFVWVAGCIAILFCGFSIDLAHRPLTIAPSTYLAAATNLETIRLPNKERALAFAFASIAIIVVWIVIIRDRWRAYEQSLDLLGIVPMRRTTITDHSGKRVGKSVETCRMVQDSHVRAEVLATRHSLKGYLPSPSHPDRPEHVLVYDRTINLSWGMLDTRMQTVDGADFKARLDLTQLLASLDSTPVTQHRLSAGTQQRVVVRDAATPLAHELQCIVSLRRRGDDLRAHTQPDLHKLTLLVQQSSIKEVRPVNLATEAADAAAARRQRRTASETADKQDAVTAFTKLLDQAASRKQKNREVLQQGW